MTFETLVTARCQGRKLTSYKTPIYPSSSLFGIVFRHICIVQLVLRLFCRESLHSSLQFLLQIYCWYHSFYLHLLFIYISLLSFFGVIFFVSSELRIDLFSHGPSIILCSINPSCLLFDLRLLLVIESNCRSCLDMLLNCLWITWNRSFCAVSGKRLLLLFISECIKLMPQLQIKALGFLLKLN